MKTLHIKRKSKPLINSKLLLHGEIGLPVYAAVCFLIGNLMVSLINFELVISYHPMCELVLWLCMPSQRGVIAIYIYTYKTDLYAKEQENHMHTLWIFYSSFLSARFVLSEDDWSLKETSSNATFTAWADLLLFFIISAPPHFPPFYFPVPLHCLFPCTHY